VIVCLIGESFSGAWPTLPITFTVPDGWAYQASADFGAMTSAVVSTRPVCP
jgi:hypothetical protein